MISKLESLSLRLEYAAVIHAKELSKWKDGRQLTYVIIDCEDLAPAIIVEIIELFGYKNVEYNSGCNKDYIFYYD